MVSRRWFPFRSRYATLLFGFVFISSMYLLISHDDSLLWGSSSSRLRLSDFPELVTHLEQNLTKVYELDRNDRTYLANELILREYANCLKNPSKCNKVSKNWSRIVIFSQHWVREAVIDGWRGGEGVWGKSMYDTAKALGYTCFFGESDFDYALRLHRLFPDQVVAIVGTQPENCYYNASCARTTSNPTGIPIYKLFDMYYFPAYGPQWKTIGPQWFLTAEYPFDWPSNELGVNHMGYSLENECQSIPHIPHNKRPRKAYVLAKTSRYFDDSVWPSEYWDNLGTELDVEFVGGFDIDQNRPPPPKCVTNIGPQSPDDFHRQIGESRILIGLADPALSPSPWVALCHGTSFLNPVFEWDTGFPDDCVYWSTQHDSLRCYSEPRVYNVKFNDYEGFKNAILLAMEDEMEPWIPNHMTQKEMTERVDEWLSKDWREEGRIAMKKWRPRTRLDWII